MRVRILLAFLFIYLNVCYSQTSNVVATITDPDGQTWNNGTFIATFVPNQTSQQNPTCNGNPNFQKQFRGSLSVGGVMTVSVCDNGFVKPPGSTWQFTLCSNTSAPCQNASQFVTGSAPNLSTQLSQQLIAPRFNNGQFAFGYLDTEVVTPVQPGGVYWNVTNNGQRLWTGTAWINPVGSGTVTSISAGTGLTGGTITGSGTIALAVPVSVANGGTGTSTPSLVAGSNVTITGSWPNQTVASTGGGSGLPPGTGLPISVASTVSLGTNFIPTVDVRWFFTNPFPTATQATSQDFGAVLSAAFTAAQPGGQCVDISGLSSVVQTLYATTNPYVGMGTSSQPCIVGGGNIVIVTGATWESPAGPFSLIGTTPPTLGEGLIIQPCNTTGGCVSPGGLTVPQFTNAATCVSSGGLNCWATGLPSSSALTSYTTGTVTCTNGARGCTGSGTAWTTALIGGFFISSCAGNACTPGSTSSYVTARISAVGSGTSLTLEGNWAGNSTAGQNYIIYKPNTPIVFCDGCLTTSAQRASTGRLFRNVGIDVNGVGGAVGYYTRAVQEGTEYDNLVCTLQQGTPTGAAEAGTCEAWDNTLREANASGQTFTGHWYGQVLRFGTGQNVGGSTSFGGVVECFSIMDGTVAASAAAGPAEMHIAAMIGGSSTRFQDDLYVDGCFDGRYYGNHLEGALNDDVNVGAVNPTSGNLFEGFSSSGTLGNAVVEFHTGTTGNKLTEITRPSGGILAQDDNLTTPVIATAVAGNQASWTLPEYIQQGNSGIALSVSGGINATGTGAFNAVQVPGPFYVASPVPGSPMSVAPAGKSAIGISSDGSLYESVLSGPISKFCTAGNGACSFNAVVTNTTNYTGNSSADQGNLIVFNCTSACTYTFNGTPVNGYWGAVESVGSTTATISLNGLNFNGASTVPVLLKDQPMFFWSDGTNFFGPAPLVAGSNVTLTAASNGLTVASSGGAGSSALSSITAATASNTIANGNFPQAWNWAQTTASQTALAFGETAAATGSGDVEIGISTAAGSTATALNLSNSLTGSQTAPAVLNLAPTWNTTGVIAGAFTINVTNTASGAGSLIAAWLVGATTELSVDKTGDLSIAGNYAGTTNTSITVFCGGANTCSPTSVGGQVGGATFMGADNSNTTASAKAGAGILRSGMTTGTANASAQEGLLQVAGGYQSNGTVTQWLMVCGTTTAWEVTNCGTSPAVNVIGAATNTQSTGHAPVSVIVAGEAIITSDNATTIGDIVCLSTTTAGNVHDNGTSACLTAGAQVGVVVQNAGTIQSLQNASLNGTAVTLSSTLAVIQLHLMGSASGGGGGTVGSSDVTAQSTSQGSTTIASTPAAANYNLRYYADVNTACTTGANTVSFTLNWTDATLAKSLTTGSLSLGSSSASSYLAGEIPIRVASGSVTYTSTVTGTCGSGTSSYDVHMVLTQ